MTKKHGNRTIIVLTRVSERELHVTYLNALMDVAPDVTTAVHSGPPFTPVGVGPADIPEVGMTKATWT